MSGTEKAELIRDIVNKALGDLAEWEPPKLMPGVGPQYPAVHQDYASRIRAYREKASENLQKKSVEVLKTDYWHKAGSFSDPLSSTNGIHFALAKELRDLKRDRPAWFASGWSVASYLIDVDHWAAAETLELHEAAFLLVGVDPRQADFERVFKRYGEDQRTDEVLYFLDDRYDLLVRKFGDPEKEPVTVPANDFCTWVTDRGLEATTALQDMVERRIVNRPTRRSSKDRTGSSNAQGNESAKPPHGNSRAYFQRVLIIIAIDKYGLKAEKDCGRVAKKIVDAGHLMGLSPDKRLLTRDLRAGFNTLCDEAKPDGS